MEAARSARDRAPTPARGVRRHRGRARRARGRRQGRRSRTRCASPRTVPAGRRVPALRVRRSSRGRVRSAIARRSTRPCARRWSATSASSSWARRSATTRAPTRSPRACCSGSASSGSSTRRSPRWASPASASARRWSGLRPIVEFMTFNFSLVAFDQIVNNAAKIHQMSAGQFNVPIVFRGPSGPAVQVGVAALAGARVDLRARARAEGRDAGDAARRQGPAQVGDPRRQPGRLHRGRDALQRERRGARRTSTSIPLGVRPTSSARASDVTLVAWSQMVQVCLEAATTLAEEGIEAEVVDPRTLRPLDVETIVEQRAARPGAA